MADLYINIMHYFTNRIKNEKVIDGERGTRRKMVQTC